MHGCANDYVVIDASRRVPGDPAALARAVCDRRRGVGADGLLLAGPSDEADLRMRMFNPDGSEAEMCGNGLRCCVLFAAAHGLVDPTAEARVETGAGVLTATILGGEARRGMRRAEVAVEMGRPRLERAALPMVGPAGRVVDEALDVAGASRQITALSMGNPHVVLFVDDVDAARVETLGPAIEGPSGLPPSARTFPSSRFGRGPS